MKESASQVLSGALIAAGLISITWMCFGPTYGFHHMYSFGVTDYLLLNGEDPQPGDHMWGEFAVRFSLRGFIASIAFWLISVFILFKLVRVLTKRKPGNQ